MKTALLAVGGFASCLLIAAPAKAGILSVSGDGQIISAPTSVVNSSRAGGYFTNGAIVGFNEKQNVFLTSNLEVDPLFNGQIGKSPKKSTSANNFIAAGKKVNSHLIFLNQKDGENGMIRSIANWKFSGKILGVMSDVNGLLMEKSDGLLGAAGTTYGASFKNRGMEAGNGYKLLSDNELNVDLSIRQPGDWLRVITEAPSQSVPEPTTMAGLLMVSALGVGLRKRKRS